MTLLMERPVASSPSLLGGTLRLFDPAGGGPTLEALVSGAWEGLAAHGSVVCPVCDGELHREPDGSAAECARCGTELG